MTAKEAVQKILNNTASNATYEEIMYSIYVREKVESGLRDINEGNFATPEEVEAELGKWDLK